MLKICCTSPTAQTSYVDSISVCGSKGAGFDGWPLLGMTMTPFHLANAIERPLCTRCHTRMMLARIAPDGPGFEVRSFECPKCGHVYTERVGTGDPMEKSRGW